MDLTPASEERFFDQIGNHYQRSWIASFGITDEIFENLANELGEGWKYFHSGNRNHQEVFSFYFYPSNKELSISSGDGIDVFFEGYLHNWIELATLLSVGDSQFIKNADLVRLAYRKWGANCLDKIQGSFTFLLSDSVQEIFWALRDRLGRYPLYFSQKNGGFVFTSSIRTLIKQLNISNDPNRVAIALSLGGLWLNREETYFTSVSRVPTSHFLQIRNRSLNLHKYWEPNGPDELDTNMHIGELEKFDNLFEQAIQRYLNFGKPGIFLSGGLDSVSIAAVATDAFRHQKQPEPIALSLAFPDPESNEEARQRGVAEILGLDQIILPFTQAAGSGGLIWDTLQLNAIFDAPVQNSWLSAYLRLAIEGKNRGCKVILTGAGGDDWLTVNSIYMADLLRFFKVVEAYRFLYSSLKSYNLPPLNMLRYAIWTSGVRPLLGLFGRKIFSKISSANFRVNRRKRLLDQKISQLPTWLMADPKLKELFYQRIDEMVDREMSKSEPEGPYGFYNSNSMNTTFDHALFSLDQEQDFELGRWLNLVYGHPFWDTDLIQFLCKIPPHLLIVGGREKSIVRDAVARRFPNLGFEKQKKVMATKFYFQNLVAEAPAAIKRLGGLHQLESSGIIRRSVSDIDFYHLITNSDFRVGYKAWELLNFEAWLRVHS